MILTGLLKFERAIDFFVTRCIHTVCACVTLGLLPSITAHHYFVNMRVSVFASSTRCRDPMDSPSRTVLCGYGHVYVCVYWRLCAHHVKKEHVLVTLVAICCMLGAAMISARASQEKSRRDLQPCPGAISIRH